MHNLKRIVGLHGRAGPFTAWQNFQVALDRYATAVHPQMIEHGSNRQTLGNFLQFPVNFYFHCGLLTSVGLSRGRIEKRISSCAGSALALMTSARSPLPSGGSGN